MLKIYPATKLHHGNKFREWNTLQRQVYFCARWLHHHSHTTPDIKEEASAFWQQDVQDIKHSDAVMVYGEPTDLLAGALVEAGIALASNIPVFIVGSHTQYSTWQYHPLVYKVSSIEEGIDWMVKFVIPSYTNWANLAPVGVIL